MATAASAIRHGGEGESEVNLLQFINVASCNLMSTLEKKDSGQKRRVNHRKYLQRQLVQTRNGQSSSASRTPPRTTEKPYTKNNKNGNTRMNSISTLKYNVSFSPRNSNHEASGIFTSPLQKCTHSRNSNSNVDRTGEHTDFYYCNISLPSHYNVRDHEYEGDPLSEFINSTSCRLDENQAGEKYRQLSLKKSPSSANLLQNQNSAYGDVSMHALPYFSQQNVKYSDVSKEHNGSPTTGAGQLKDMYPWSCAEPNQLYEYGETALDSASEFGMILNGGGLEHDFFSNNDEEQQYTSFGNIEVLPSVNKDGEDSILTANIPSHPTYNSEFIGSDNFDFDVLGKTYDPQHCLQKDGDKSTLITLSTPEVQEGQNQVINDPTSDAFNAHPSDSLNSSGGLRNSALTEKINSNIKQKEDSEISSANAGEHFLTNQAEDASFPLPSFQSSFAHLWLRCREQMPENVFQSELFSLDLDI